jgi:hypothetical protein
VAVVETLPGHAVWDAAADRCAWLRDTGSIRVRDLSRTRPHTDSSAQAPPDISFEVRGAVAIFGGALLTVVTDGAGGEPVMVMLGWDGAAAGGNFAGARDVVWAKDGSVVALVYDTQVVVLANGRGVMLPLRTLHVAGSA